MPSGPTTKLPLRKSPCTSAGGRRRAARARRASAARARARDAARRTRRGARAAASICSARAHAPAARAASTVSIAWIAGRDRRRTARRSACGRAVVLRVAQDAAGDGLALDPVHDEARRRARRRRRAARRTAGTGTPAARRGQRAPRTRSPGRGARRGRPGRGAGRARDGSPARVDRVERPGLPGRPARAPPQPARPRPARPATRSTTRARAAGSGASRATAPTLTADARRRPRDAAGAIPSGSARGASAQFLHRLVRDSSTPGLYPRSVMQYVDGADQLRGSPPAADASP